MTEESPRPSAAGFRHFGPSAADFCGLPSFCRLCRHPAPVSPGGEPGPLKGHPPPGVELGATVTAPHRLLCAIRNPHPATEGPRAMRRFLLPLFLGACSFLGGLAAVALTGGALPPLWAAAPSAARAADDLGKLSDRFEVVARKASPAVVAVEAVKPAKGKGRATDDSGSGVLVRPPGHKGTL